MHASMGIAGKTKRGLLLSALPIVLLSVVSASGSHLDFTVPDLHDTDLKGPVKSIETRVSINVSGKFERTRTEYNRTGDLVIETEWDSEEEMLNTLTNFYDGENGAFSSQTYIDFEDEYTNNWEVFLSPETCQIALKKESPESTRVYTYNKDGYVLNYKRTNKDKKLTSASETKRDGQNRRTEFTKFDEDRKPLYTYWFRWKDNGRIDRERQKYRQEKGERLHIYEYLETDEYGNWTQRLMVRYDIEGKEKEKIFERLVVRKIRYFTAEEPEEKSDKKVYIGGEETEPEENVLKIGLSQEELGDYFSYTFDDIADKLVIINCRSERGRSSGSGFIAKMDGKTYLFTNQHVIMGADTIRLQTAEGETIIPIGGIELSCRRDITRIEVEERDAFDIATRFSIGGPLGVFGNSEGAGVATELYGEVTGLGADIVEVNAEFVRGNSGSPVLDTNQDVIGIASYLRVTWEPPKKNKDQNTDDDEESDEEEELESKVRRFCYRLDDLKWQPVNWKKYNKKYGKLYRNSEATAQDVFDIIDIWSGNVLRKIPEKEDLAPDLMVWVKKHNDIIDRYERRKFKKNNFINAYSGSLEILSDICFDRSQNIKMFSRQRELSGFLKDEFEKTSRSLEYASYFFLEVADNLDNEK